LKGKLLSADEPIHPNSDTDLEFIPDSPEQVLHSIERIGFRDKLDKAFKVAIKHSGASHFCNRGEVMDIQLPTWDGRSQFKYHGSANNGTNIYYGKGFNYRVSITAEIYRKMLRAFKGCEVPCGTNREVDKRPKESLGYWLGQNVTKTAIASYVAQILIHEGYATKRERIISFT